MNSNQILARYDITYRQLDTWTTNGYLGEAKKPGQGTHREYSAREVRVLSGMVALVKAGVRPEIASKIARGDSAANAQLQAALEAVRHGI